MYTSVAVLALSGFLAAAPADRSPSWLTDYSAARAQGKRQHKPLAVFLGKGQSGWNQVSRDGEWGPDIKQVLTNDYVCVYLDTSKRPGRHLAADLEIPEGVGLVLSDRTGQLQAFRHEGDLPSDRLTGYLRRFADPDLVVRTTETNDSRQVRYYPPEEVRYYPAQSYAPPVAPVQYGGFGGFSGGGRSC